MATGPCVLNFTGSFSSGSQACRSDPFTLSTRTCDRYAMSPMRPPVCAILPPMNTVDVDSRERVQIRMRESGVTLAAWRVSLKDPAGAIVLAEVGGKSFYRGEGGLLGLPQDR